MVKKAVANKAKILKLLLPQAQVSGQQLAVKLGISRTQVWKEIKQLQAVGYQIKAMPKNGYQLLKSPDTVCDFAVLSFLPEDYEGDVISSELTSSTNDIAKELAANRAPDGSIVIAERQLQGRGRLGHSWSSPSGGVWFTLILRPSLPVSVAPRFALWAAVVVAETVRDETGAALAIKWPNDLMLAERKVGGILVEMAAEIGRINYLIIGIGLNANFNLEALSPDLHAKTTTLATYLGHKINRPKLIAALAFNLKNNCSQVGQNFDEILQRWRRLALTLNRRIKLKAGAVTFTGQALDVDNYGALVVKLDNGQVKHFQAGEVTVIK